VTSIEKSDSTPTVLPIQITVNAMASGVEKSTFKSCAARRGSDIMGTEVADPVTRKSPSTAAYVIRHSTQTTLSRKNDAYARYRTTASSRVYASKRYTGR